MENNVEPSQYKDKFGALLSRLHEIGFSDEIITKTILEHPFFSYFEKNKSEIFLKTPLEDIIQNVFHRDNVVLDYSSPFISEYFYAGGAYFSLLLDYKIPLERSFLIYPLSKMIERFNPYHEMSFSHLATRYLEDEKKIGIFRALRKWRNLTVREISVLTKIKMPTLVSYNSNVSLMNASFENISLLSEAFHVRISTFKNRSSFYLLPYELLHDESFLKEFKKELVLYFDIDEGTLLIDTYKTDKELSALVKMHKVLIYLPDFALVKYQGRVVYRFLKEEEIGLLVKNSMRE